MQTKSTMNGVMQAPEDGMEEIQLTIEAAREIVAKRDALLKLSKNKTFKDIIMKGYLEDEAVRLTALSGHHSTVEFRDEIFDGLKAISHFRQWMENTLMQGDLSEQSIKEHELMRDEAFETAEFV